MSFQRIRDGINLGGLTSDPVSANPGDTYYNSATNKLRVYNGTSWEDVATGDVDLSGYLKADGSVPLTADLDADGNTIINVVDPTNEQDAATKNYVDVEVAAVQTDVDDLVTLSGVAINSTDLGSFTGSIIPDASDIKEALQSLETAVEALPDPIVYKGTWDASTNTPTLADGVGTVGDLYQVNVAGSQDLGSGTIEFAVGDKVVYDGTVWEKWDMTDSVTSVNGQTGTVVLDTDDVTEGSINLYFTDVRAQTASVVDSTAGDETVQAASVSAMKDYVATEIAAIDLTDYLKRDGTNTITGNILPNAANTIRMGSGTVPFNRIDSSTFVSASFRGQGSSAGKTPDLRVGTIPSDAVEQDSGNLNIVTGTSDAVTFGDGLGSGTTGNIVISTGNTQGDRGEIIMSGFQLNVSGMNILNMADPIDPQDAATKAYVDSVIPAVGANTTLSNLTSPTAINQDLLADTTFTRSIGSDANRFYEVYAGNINAQTNVYTNYYVLGLPGDTDTVVTNKHNNVINTSSEIAVATVPAARALEITAKFTNTTTNAAARISKFYICGNPDITTAPSVVETMSETGAEILVSCTAEYVSSNLVVKFVNASATDEVTYVAEIKTI